MKGMNLKNEKGNITILVSVIMLILMSSMAFVIDIGVVYAEKAKLSKAIDASILAGGMELPDNKSGARTIMEEYLLLNGVSLDQVSINIADDGLSAEIIGTKIVPHYFAKVMGFESTDITERSKIILGAAGSVKGGLRPFGITKFDFQYGDPITLKEGAGDSYHGNFGTVALGSTGVSVLLENALYGYAGEIKIGDYIDTEPGNMASLITPIAYYINSIDETFETAGRGSDRIWTVPVFESMEVDGRDAIQVIAFAQVYVELVQKVGGTAEIKARFVQYVVNGDINTEIENTGVYGMKLVN